MDVDESASWPSKEQSNQHCRYQHDVPQWQVTTPIAEFNQRAILLCILRILIWSAIIREHHYRRNNNENQHDDQTEYEHQVGVVIMDTDTVIDPGAVVVESLNTSVTGSAVFRPLCPQHLTIGAHFRWVNLFQQVDERDRWS